MLTSGGWQFAVRFAVGSMQDRDAEISCRGQDASGYPQHARMLRSPHIMRGAVYVNGTIAPADQAVVPVYDHGFVYGEGVYETLRTYNRVPFLFERHIQRLRRSAHYLTLAGPFDDATLRQWIESTMEAANLAAGEEAYIRILLTRGVGELS